MLQGPRGSPAISFQSYNNTSEKKMILYYLFLCCFVTIVTATLVPPTSVSWTADPTALFPTIQSGRISISWSPAIGSVDSYQVVVAPLDYTDTLTDPVYSGFVLVSEFFFFFQFSFFFVFIFLCFRQCTYKYIGSHYTV